MRDTAKQLRIAVANALQGNIGVNLYDEKVFVQDAETAFVILGTQQEVPVEANDCTWVTKSTIDIEVYQKTGSEASKNTIDDISNLILGILITAPYVTPLTSPNLQFQLATVDSIISRNISIDVTDTVLQKVIRFSVTIVQQN